MTTEIRSFLVFPLIFCSCIFPRPRTEIFVPSATNLSGFSQGRPSTAALPVVTYWAAKLRPMRKPEEISERERLRRIYIDSVKANLVGQLENTYIVSPDGTKKKLERK